jgi:hypothetical protein
VGHDARIGGVEAVRRFCEADRLSGSAWRSRLCRRWVRERSCPGRYGRLPDYSRRNS